MAGSIQTVRLDELLRRSSEITEIRPKETYQQITVRLWGQGVTQRNRVVGAEIKASRRLVASSGQFIVSRIDARNGAFGLVPDELDGAVVSSDFPLIDIDQSKVVPGYLHWMSKTANFVDLCKAASEGSTNRVRLKEDKFLAMEIPLPPLDEQRRLVARIEELAAKIEEARRLRELLNQDVHRMLLSAYQRIVGNVCRMPMVKIAPLHRRKVDVKIDEQYPELGVRSFGKGTFHKPSLGGLEVGNKKLFKIESGDLIFNIVFAWEGAVAIAQPEDSGRVGSHRFLTCVPNEGQALSSFLLFHFLTQEGLQQLGDASPGGAGRNRTLGIKALENIEVPVPKYEHQEWFDSLISRRQTMASVHQRSSAELDALLPSILNAAFSGKF